MAVHITLKIVKAVVLERAGTDIVHLDTDCPPPFDPEVSPEPLRLQFETPKGRGVKYVSENFMIEAETIKING